MTPDQLAAARASHWHQDARPLMTLEDATTWIEQMQLALYLPRRAHVLAPAPSFVEAVAGQGGATPAPDAIAGAAELLVRMVQEGTVVPLNLFGTPGEQPDFLVATTTLPHLAALQADRNWKKPPSRTGPGKVSPMAIEVWKLLDREGALTASEIREQLGHELTEAATIRGLSELWQNMRVAPLPLAGGEAAHWQILSVTHKKEMAAGGTMSQSAALSMLVSNYLQSIVTGTVEDIEAFLSPIASRSRLRDVVRGLTATRQLRTLSMDAQTFLFIEGTLPEMPEVAVANGLETKPAFMGRSAYRERMLQRGKEEEPAASADEETPGLDRAPVRPAPRSDRPQRSEAGRGSTFRKTSAGRPDRPTGGRSTPGRPVSSRPGFERSRFSRPPAGDSSGTGAGGPRPRSDRSFGGPSGRPFRPSGSSPAQGRSGSDRPRFGAAKPFPNDRPRTDRPSSNSGGGGPFRTRPGSGSQERSASGSRPPFRSGAEDRGSRPFRPRVDSDAPRGEKRPFRPREDAPPDKRNSSRAGFLSRTGGRPGHPTGDRPRPDRSAGDRPSAGRPRPPRAEGDRPFTPRPRTQGTGDSRPLRRNDARPPYPRRDSRGSGEGRPPRREGGGSGFPSNPNRPSRAPRPAGNFVKREGGAGDRRSGSRPSTGRSTGGDRGRSGTPGRPPGRNPGGTGRPGGPRVGGNRPFGARGGTRPTGAGSNPPRSGGMKPPTRKPRPEKDSE